MNDHTHDTEDGSINLQALVDYYRNKSSKIEHEFLLYQLKAESIIRTLQSQIADAQQKPGRSAKSEAE